MATFYLEHSGAVGDVIALPEEESKHALRVLRLGEGDEICAHDGLGGRFAAVIEDTSGCVARVRLIEVLPSNEPPVRVTLYQGLPKADKLDFIVQKATELGAAAIVPVKMERSVVKCDAKDGAKRRERLEKIAHEATKQCRRACMPIITEPATWKQAFVRMKAHDLVLVPWEDARGVRVCDAIAQRPQARDIGLVIGPEGGMSEAEVGALRELGATAVTLGPRILRAETAAVAAVTLTMAFCGDL